MSQAPFSPEWLNQFTDPYAVLGVSVAADERRLLKRYHLVAKRLHPDVQTAQAPEQREFVQQVLTKLVNPAYQRLKQEKNRSETLATLRFKVRRLSRDHQLNLEDEASRRLLKVPEAEVDVAYEHALEQLSNRQYSSAADFERCTQALGELNLAYLKRKMGDAIIREKRSGLIGASAPKPASEPQTSPKPESSSASTYAERHYQRAQEYLKAQNLAAAIQELKDAIKLEPHNSHYHCLMGQAYLHNKLTGMAKVHFKQALRLNPQHGVALKYARQLQIDLTTPSTPRTKPAASSPAPAQLPQQGRLLSRLFSKR
ncbi:MAG TPA: DnaJ domain-containing protein [Leptolyngbyaceae cyanobacterium M65_K2018_010]|nr:DnaJ domain-containing protein [Leptolyngbyaceae cyanobacterium M65_K2018_010]